MSAADSTGRRIAAELRKQSANKAVQRPLGFSPLFSAVYGKPRQEQFRFPRSKRWRIRKKWRKDPRGCARNDRQWWRFARKETTV